MYYYIKKESWCVFVRLGVSSGILGPPGVGAPTAFRSLLMLLCIKSLQVGKDQEKAHSEKDSHTKKRGGKKQTNNQVIVRLSLMRKTIIIS